MHGVTLEKKCKSILFFVKKKIIHTHTHTYNLGGFEELSRDLGLFLGLCKEEGKVQFKCKDSEA